jgi:thiamine kinase-like enzyme
MQSVNQTEETSAINLRRIEFFLDSKKWVRDAEASFLAAGEYNENYHIASSDGRQFVFRINRGSQLALENQIQYEYLALESLSSSGVTPQPFFFDPAPNEFDAGVLLMEFLPGRALQYETDSGKAAIVFSKTHQIPPSPALIRQPDPVAEIIRESEGLLARYPHHPRTEINNRLREYADTLKSRYQNSEKIFIDDIQCIVNTEVNSGNFLIHDGKAALVDWEKAVVSCAYQDLAHFTVPTTTLWKSDFVFDADGLRSFLITYLENADLPINLTELMAKTEILKETILLRGLSWCYMAYYEYVENIRAIRNEDTFKKIKCYLDDIEWFLN